MNIQLQRTVKVEKFKVILDIGIKEPRTDILADIKIAAENNNQLDTRIICDQFIFRDHPVMAERILKRCQDFGLIDEEGNLTDDGFDAIRDGQIYHPHTGVYEIWATQDPLLPQCLLDIRLVEDSINFRDEIHNEKQNSPYDKNTQIETKTIEILPGWIQNLGVLLNIQLVDDAQRDVRIEHIEEKGELLSVSKDLIAKVYLSEESKELQLEGLFNTTRNIENFPSFVEVWEQFLGNNINYWDWNTRKFAKSFESLSDIEKSTFQTTLRFNRPEIKQFGVFDSFSSRKIPLKPMNASDANHWASWLILKNLSNYIFPEYFETLKADIKKKFPEFSISFESREDIQNFFESTRSNNEYSNQYWYAHAPLDLVPISNNQEELH